MLQQTAESAGIILGRLSFNSIPLGEFLKIRKYCTTLGLMQPQFDQ